MPDVITVLRSALDEEPPLGFGAADVITRARRARRRRRGLSLAGLALAGAGVVVLVLAVVSTPASRSLSKTRALSMTAVEHAAATRAISRPDSAAPSASVDGLSAAELPGLVERGTGIALAKTSVTVLRPGRSLDLAAGLATAGKPYLNVQVIPAHGLITAMPTCAQLSNLSSGQGDGYHGPCRITRIADGSIFIVRSGDTATGGFAMAQALLIRPDGSGIFAEDTNQAGTAPRTIRHSRTTGRLITPPVVQAQPPLDANAMANLVRYLARTA